MSNLSYTAFKQAFDGILNFEDSQLGDGRLRHLGASGGVGLELIRASHNSDVLDSAALQFSHSGLNTPFDQLSTNCVIIFLAVLLGDAQHAHDWFVPASIHLQSPDTSNYESAQDGFILRLLQIKPFGMFLLSARPQ
jgi:hypothetical protein